MRDLHAGRYALLVQETDDRRQRLDVGVAQG
jgi:hypothetical protein